MERMHEVAQEFSKATNSTMANTTKRTMSENMAVEAQLAKLNEKTTEMHRDNKHLRRFVTVQKHQVNSHWFRYQWKSVYLLEINGNLCIYWLNWLDLHVHHNWRVGFCRCIMMSGCYHLLVSNDANARLVQHCAAISAIAELSFERSCGISASFKSIGSWCHARNAATETLQLTYLI